MKRILILALVCSAFAFTGCTENVYDNKETEVTEERTEGMLENTESIEDKDKEYLINLANQLEIRLAEKEIVNKIGEADEYLGSGILNLWVYRKGKYELYINIDALDKIDNMYIYDSENEKTIIDYTEEGKD